MKMKTLTGLLFFLFACGLFASVSLARPWQGWRGSDGWGMNSPYQRTYNQASVETLTGEIVDIETTVPQTGMSSGIHLTVKTAKETIAVHLGPEWFIERLDTKLAKGDSVTVKGSRVTFDGKPVIIAAEVKKGDAVLLLRNEAGVPAWSGMGMRNR